MNRFRLATALAVAVMCSVSSGCGGGGSGGGGGGGAVEFQTSGLAAATTGVEYQQQMVATFPNPPGTFFVASGTLPTGLTLDAYTGVVAGYPRQVGTFLFDVAARDGIDPALPPGRDANYSQSEKRFTVSVARGAPNLLPQVVPAATYRGTYSYSFDVAGGTTPWTFSLSAGPLPAGVALSSNGLLSGFPTQAGLFPFQVTVTDATGLSDVASYELDVRVKPLLILTSGAIQPAAQGFPYDYVLQLASNGGGEPFTWSQATPTGTEIDLSTIGLQVTPSGHVTDLGLGPTAIGTFDFSVQVTDEPGQVATRALSITVNPGPTLVGITPKNASTVGMYTATGLNFQPGATLIVKPGPTERTITTTFVNATTLTFSSPVPKPTNGSGPQPVMVRNPDGGEFTLPAGLVFPAQTIAFGTKAFVASSLSSTGLDVADVNNDGWADIVHSGTSGQAYVQSTNLSTAAGLYFHLNLQTDPVTFSTVVLDTISYNDVKFADVNTDGRLDVVGLGSTTVRTFLGTGAGTFSGGTTTALNGPGAPQFPSELTIGKFNNDLVPDIAFGVPHFSWMGYSNVNGRVYSMYGNGTGGFTNLDQAVTSITNTYGVLSIAAIDTNGDGRHEVAAGIGMYPYTGPPLNFSATNTSGTFSGWSPKGGTLNGPYYGSTTGMAVGDFLGNGGQQLVTATSGSPNYNNTQIVQLHSGTDIATVQAMPAVGACTKGVTAVDADFDAKIDFAVAIQDAKIVVYKANGLTVATTLDASAGTPAISSPRVGQIASGDVNGDGAPDIIGTTSSWAVNGMASNYGTSYQMNTTGNGGSMGLVIFLNTSN
jgi:hypothetical protein